jgi:hypothetical protein
VKPHEQEWRWDDGSGPGIRDGRRRVFRGEATTTADDIALAVAAPELARDALADLEEHGGAFSSDPCRCARCERKRAILRKAGVL